MTNDFVPFELEQIQAAWLNRIEIDLSESGVHPMTMRELVQDPVALQALVDSEITYAPVMGDPQLRANIAALYPGATAENVLVTVGAIQANFTTLLTLTDPGDDVAVMQPNYQQLWGLAQNTGRRLSTFALKGDRGWALDQDELEAAVKPTTKLVTVVNPNNPTGRIMPAGERAAIIEAASKADAWLLADEVYAGAETRTDEFTPTFYGDYGKVLAIGSMSKAYGLPGLRIGWVVGPREAVDRMVEWAYYITIVATHFGNKLAAVATSPEVRPRILERTRTYVRRGFDMVERWAAARGDVELTPPDASPVSVVKYNRRIASRDLVERLAREKSVFVVPGDLFGLEGYVRINHGMPDGYVEEGLRRFGELLDEVE
jgi:aspartate/methionine/tyrosine aminotransferase